MRRSTSSSWAVVAALLAACSLIVVASAASAADGDREKVLAALAKQTGASVDDLRSVDAHHWVTGDLDAKRSFLKKICDEPREGLLPFVAFIAGNEREHQLRLAAIKAISLFGLLADRWDVRKYAFPVLVANTRDKSGQVVRFSLDELGRLNRWFRLDAELAPFYEKLFRGRDFNLKQLAFFALNDMKNREIVEKIVKPAAWKVYESKKSGIFMQRDAVGYLAGQGERAILPEMQKNLTGDASLAVVSAYGLGRILDDSSLPALRKVDQTAVHRLRRLAWRARVRLGDPECIVELPKVVESRTEHADIKAALIVEMGAYGNPEWDWRWRNQQFAPEGSQSKPRALPDKANAVVDKMLERYFGASDAKIKQAAALALLWRGDDRGVDLLIEQLKGEWPDDPTLGRAGKGWQRRFRFFEWLLDCPSPKAAPVLAAIARLKSPEAQKQQGDTGSESKGKKEGDWIYLEWWRHGSRREETITDWYDEYKSEAVAWLGERGDQSALKSLKDIYFDKDSWGHIKFHAAISRWELGDEKAEKDVAWLLPKYDDRIFRDQRVIMGPVTAYFDRFKWSTVFDVARKAERKKDPRYVALMDQLMRTEEEGDDPVARRQKEGGGDGGGAGEKKPAGTRTTGRNKKGKALEDERELLGLPEVRYRLRNQFARRAALDAAAYVGDEKAAALLARGLLDCRATVRAAALRQIGRISGRYELDFGAPVEEERGVRPDAVAWLKEQGVWPGGE